MNINCKQLTKKKLCCIIVLGIFVVGAVGVYAYHSRQSISTDDATIDGNTVILSPKVQGYIKQINVKDNQQVHAGDVIMEIDPTDYQTKLNSAQTDLAAAQAALDAAVHQDRETAITAPAKVTAANEQMKAAQATWKKALLDKQRMSILAESGACSQKELDQAGADESQSKATVDQYAANLAGPHAAP